MTKKVELVLVQHHETEDAYAVSEYEKQDPVWLGKAHVSRYFEIGRTKPNVILGTNQKKHTGKWGAPVVHVELPEKLAVERGLTTDQLG